MDRDDRTTDTGMLGSEAENPGPGRDTSRSDPDPAATSTEHPTRSVGMSGADPQRTRLGSQETGRRLLAGAPQDAPAPAATPAAPTPNQPPQPMRAIRRPRPCPTPTRTGPGSAATSLANLGTEPLPCPMREAGVPEIAIRRGSAG